MALRILIVEDNQIIALNLLACLNRSGFETVGPASSGEEALQLALINQPDLLLIDIELNGELDGIAAASLIKAELDIPIVYASACSDTEFIQRANDTKPFGYLVKPFREPELAITLNLAFYQHQQQLKMQREIRNLFQELHK